MSDMFFTSPEPVPMSPDFLHKLASDARQAQAVYVDSEDAPMPGQAVAIFFSADQLDMIANQWGAEQYPTGIVGAHLALDHLRASLETLRTPDALHIDGKGPTHADNLQQLLELLERSLKMIERYIA